MIFRFCIPEIILPNFSFFEYEACEFWFGSKFCSHDGLFFITEKLRDLTLFKLVNDPKDEQEFVNDETFPTFVGIVDPLLP
jgi:hypothetical protein